METMTQALKRTIKKSGASLYSIEAATGVAKASLIRFMRGDQSLRLDMADRLALHFNLRLTGGFQKKGKC